MKIVQDYSSVNSTFLSAAQVCPDKMVAQFALPSEFILPNDISVVWGIQLLSLVGVFLALIKQFSGSSKLGNSLPNPGGLSHCGIVNPFSSNFNQVFLGQVLFGLSKQQTSTRPSKHGPTNWALCMKSNSSVKISSSYPILRSRKKF